MTKFFVKALVVTAIGDRHAGAVLPGQRLAVMGCEGVGIGAYQPVQRSVLRAQRSAGREQTERGGQSGRRQDTLCQPRSDDGRFPDCCVRLATQRRISRYSARYIAAASARELSLIHISEP